MSVIALIGDSITRGFGGGHLAEALQELRPDDDIRRYAEVGLTMSPNGSRPYEQSAVYPKALNARADVYVIMLGSNDTNPDSWQGKDVFGKEYAAFVSIFEMTGAKVILCTVPHVFPKREDPVMDFDLQWPYVPDVVEAVKAVAAEKGLGLIDVYSATSGCEEVFNVDGVHPRREGGQVIAGAIHQGLLNHGI